MKSAKLKAYEQGHAAESIAAFYLMLRGYRILKRRYKTPVGEIDIIAKKDSALHFVEVKSLKVRDCNQIDNLTIKPEDNLTQAKWSKLLITVQTYLNHKNVPYETPYQVDLACVYIDTEKREGRVKLMQNISME